MRPFNLIEALSGKPVITRDGREVMEVKHFPNATRYQVVVMVKGEESEPQTYTAEGKFNPFDPLESDWDLMMKPRPQTVYVNMWLNEDHGFPFVHANVFNSQVEAERERTISCTGNKKHLLKRFEFTYEI